MEFYAHTLDGEPPEKWEPLFTPDCLALTGGHCEACESLAPNHGHLNKVAWWTAKFAVAMFPSDSSESKAAWHWGYVAGLWHDLGKFLTEFQKKLDGESLHVEHAGAGAALAFNLMGKNHPSSAAKIAFASAIAGHHSGLPNTNSQGEGNKLRALIQRIKDNQNKLTEALSAADWTADGQSAPPLLPFMMPVKTPQEMESAFRRTSFFTRMLFSCLVDADSLATEAFTKHDSLRNTISYDSLKTLTEKLDAKLDAYTAAKRSNAPSRVNTIRSEILKLCRAAASSPPGIFSLNVPTGGGKTLSGMSFALRHAVHHAMQRVVVVIPYTSIIEQNAAEYAKYLGKQNVLEHHSNLDDFADIEEGNPDAIRRRLCTENWDAPVIVTTTVQFFESLFSNKRSRCRKLHNIARSVIILDEAQCLPASYLKASVLALRELVESYGCSVVLSTATQPALFRREKFPEGFPNITPIISDEKSADYHAKLSDGRCNVDWSMCAAPVPYTEIATDVAAQPQGSLSIVHRRKDAVELFHLVQAGLSEIENPPTVFHLSTHMIPRHRKLVLARIKRMRRKKQACHIVSTQLVEAGVNLDLPVVFRAMAGFDSVAQAAGRCNREDQMDIPGQVFVFKAETEPPDPHLKRCAQITASLLEERGSLKLGDLSVSRAFFEKLYFSSDLDPKAILREILSFNFETIARNFHLIENDHQVAVIVPCNADARDKVARVREQSKYSDKVSRHLLRSLQPYTVNVWKWDFDIIQNATEPLFPDAETAVLNIQLFPHLYDETLGLVIPEQQPQPSHHTLVCS